ncbi:hypothetical protein DMN91_009929 [Ooceraea biroi]|uniref:MADF domain-containing protein n=1 Tax=Ooceraea biroi TaxID=2015173 RepID=A0A3L8DC37_OOCBI|nr:uncharacterized protein LOC105281524 [Ooceraea biroi]RLU17693.1 hypothetical protein DMN91_009929 [Ooceraea biroi]
MEMVSRRSRDHMLQSAIFGITESQSRSMDLTKEQTKMLVLYEQHPCLYVQKSEDYHNRDKRLKALQTIAQQFHEMTGYIVSIDVIKKKIASLGTQYLEQINKIQKSKSSGAGTDDVFKPTWWLFEELSFLAPHIASRKGESSISKNIVTKSYVDTFSSSQDREYDEDVDDLCFVDVQRVLGSNSHNIPKKDFSAPIKTINSSATPSTSHNKTEEIFEIQSVHSDTSSVSSLQLTSGKESVRKKKKIESKENTSEAFWTNVNTVLKDINKDDHEDDGLHHWILFLKSELKCIKDKRRLRRVQADILHLV